MQATEIKKLVESYQLDQLMLAEEAILEGNTAEITIGGKDEGEQLTHISAAIWIHQEMEKGADFRAALRAFMEKVRNSIS
jgi:hypothetical protein